MIRALEDDFKKVVGIRQVLLHYCFYVRMTFIHHLIANKTLLSFVSLCIVIGSL